MAAEEKSTVLPNATYVRPEYFYFGGMLNIPHVKYFCGFLLFVYIVTVCGNVFLLSVIYQARNLHTPKYMIVCNLALVDLCESTAFIPRVLETLLFDRRYILYEACISSMFFVYFFASMQSWMLVTMAYDRLIAICFPLRYSSLVTRQSIAAILLFVWGFILCIVTFTMNNVDYKIFCASVVISNCFCEYVATFTLACNDTTLDTIMLYVASVIFLLAPLIFIIITYICIGIALIRIASAQERRRAMKTCISHLILVTIFFLPITTTTIATLITHLDTNFRMIDHFFTLVVPAFLNPIIYSLKTEEVLNSIKKLCGGNHIFKIFVAKLSKNKH